MLVGVDTCVVAVRAWASGGDSSSFFDEILGEQFIELSLV